MRREGRVRWGGSAYSAAPAWLGHTVTVYGYRAVVVLYYQGRAVRHARVPENRPYSLLPEHPAALFVQECGRDS